MLGRITNIINVEELEGVGVLGGSDNAEPFAHLVCNRAGQERGQLDWLNCEKGRQTLLQVFFGEVLEVALGNRNLGAGDGETLGLAGDLNLVTELARAVVDLVAVLNDCIER